MSKIIMGIVPETLVTQAGRMVSGDALVQRPETAIEPASAEGKAEDDVSFATLVIEVPATPLIVVPDARSNGDAIELPVPEDRNPARLHHTGTPLQIVPRIPFGPSAFQGTEPTAQPDGIGRIDTEVDENFVSISPENVHSMIDTRADVIRHEAPEIAVRSLPEPDLSTETPAPAATPQIDTTLDRSAMPLRPTQIDVAPAHPTPVDPIPVDAPPQSQPAPIHPSDVDHGIERNPHLYEHLGGSVAVSALPAFHDTEDASTPSDTNETPQIEPQAAVPYAPLGQHRPQTAQTMEQPPLPDGPEQTPGKARDPSSETVGDYAAMMLSAPPQPRPETHADRTGTDRKEVPPTNEVDGHDTMQTNAAQSFQPLPGTTPPVVDKIGSIPSESTASSGGQVVNDAPPPLAPTVQTDTDAVEPPAPVPEGITEPEPATAPPAPVYSAGPASPTPSNVAPPVAPTALPHVDMPAPMAVPSSAQTADHDVPPVAQQVAIAVSKSDGGTIDLALRPVELGETQINMDFEAERLIVTIATERPETQDLMRRHIDDLAREFRDLGYRDVSFRFEQQAGQHGQPRPAPPDPPTSNQGGIEPDLFPETPGPQPTYVSARLDIRL